MSGCYSDHCGVPLCVEVLSEKFIDPVYQPLLTFMSSLFRGRVGKINLDRLTDLPTQLYEDPDKLTSRGQGNYELTHCPAYESTTTKPEPPPRNQAEVDQSSHYEL